MANTSHDNPAYILSLFKGDPWMAVYICEAVLILTGNSIVIYIFWSIRKKLKRTSYLLINLAVADFLVGMAITLWLLHGIAGILEQGVSYGVGETAMVMDIIGTTSSVLSLVLISLERMLAILWPFRHRLLNLWCYHVSVGFIWFVSALNMLLNVFLAPYYNTKTEHSYIIFTSIIFITSVMIITGVYLAIWISTRRNQIRGTTLRKMEQNRKLTKTLFLVTALSIITCLPCGISIAFKDYLQHMYSFRVQIIIAAQYANSFLNPFVYYFKMPEFQQSLRKLICPCPLRPPSLNENKPEPSSGITLRSVKAIECL